MRQIPMVTDFIVIGYLSNCGNGIWHGNDLEEAIRVADEHARHGEPGERHHAEVLVRDTGRHPLLKLMAKWARVDTFFGLPVYSTIRRDQERKRRRS